MYLILDDKKIKIRTADTFFKKLIGLLGEKEVTYGMLFRKTNSIHTFFMKDSIDVIALDNHNEVILKAENVPKNKIISAHNKIKNTSILELPKNTSKNVKIGDTLAFIRK